MEKYHKNTHAHTTHTKSVEKQEIASQIQYSSISISLRFDIIVFVFLLCFAGFYHQRINYIYF